MALTRLFHASAWAGLRPIAAGLMLAALFFAGCDTGPAETLWDPDPEVRPDPVITAVQPAEQSLAGVGEVVILGQNFSADPTENLVFFDAVRVNILSNAADRIVVASPNLPKDDVQVKVAVEGAVNFSNIVEYDLKPAVVDFANILAFEEPFALASDDEGNIYVSLFANGVSAGVKKITPAGQRSDFVSTTFKWDGMDLGPDGALYTVRGVRAIFRFAGAGANQETYAVASNASARFTAIDVLADGSMYVGGSGGAIYYVDAAKNISEFAFAPVVRDLRVYDGALYVAATENNTDSKVWRFPIGTDGALGDPSLYYDVSGQHDGALARALAFASNGELFVGTTAEDPVLLVAAGGGSGEVLYPGIMEPTAISFAWGEAPFLYLSRSASSDKNAGITRINTQREPAP